MLQAGFQVHLQKKPSFIPLFSSTVLHFVYSIIFKHIMYNIMLPLGRNYYNLYTTSPYTLPELGTIQSSSTGGTEVKPKPTYNRFVF